MNSFQASHWSIPQRPPYAWVFPAFSSRSSLREALKQGAVPNWANRLSLVFLTLCTCQESQCLPFTGVFSNIGSLSVEMVLPSKSMLKKLLILRSYVDLLNYPFNYIRESHQEAGILESTIGGHIVTRIQWTLSSGAEVNYSVVQQWLLMLCYCSNCLNKIATVTAVQKFF